MSSPRVLYVTDLAYVAKGRVYRDEDLMLSTRLGEHLDLALCDPRAAESLMAGFDVVVVRNSGPVIHYREAYDSFRAAAIARGVTVFTELSGSADMVGKQYLVDLSRAGAAVIPTVDRPADLGLLPPMGSFVVKPKLGSDSIGMRTVGAADLASLDLDGSMLVQPTVDFVHEVSFVFVDREFHYALHAPDPLRRWELRPFAPSADDLAFARYFIEWNAIDHGIQRVDACRLSDGTLLLMELEDLNPYLSLDVVEDATVDRFVGAMQRSIIALVNAGQGRAVS